MKQLFAISYTFMDKDKEMHSRNTCYKRFTIPWVIRVLQCPFISYSVYLIWYIEQTGIRPLKAPISIGWSVFCQHMCRHVLRNSLCAATIFLHIFHLIILVRILVAAIALERYIGTFMALRYDELVTPFRVRVAVMSAIIYPLLLMIPMALAQHRWSPTRPCIFPVIFPPWVVHMAAGHVEIVLVLIAILYIMILKQAYGHKRRIAIQIDRGQSEQTGPSTSMRQGLEVIKSFALIIGVFVLSLMPGFILSQYVSHDPMRQLANPGIGYLFILTNVTLFANNIINPIIYAFTFKAYKKAFKTLLGYKAENANP